MRLWSSDQRMMQQMVQIAVYNSSDSAGEMYIEAQRGEAVIQLIAPPGNTATYLGRSIESVYIKGGLITGNGTIEGKYVITAVIEADREKS